MYYKQFFANFFKIISYKNFTLYHDAEINLKISHLQPKFHSINYYLFIYLFIYTNIVKNFLRCLSLSSLYKFGILISLMLLFPLP
jgi:hypothetical protein